jgi:PiT family inorganic phosphate transporter
LIFNGAQQTGLVDGLIELIVLLAGFFVAWNIGANDTSNCVGAGIGARIISYRRAIMIVVLFFLLGATLEGWKNMKTVGEGIVVAAPGGESPLSVVPLATVAALFSAGVWVLACTIIGLPISTSHSMIGAVIGAGLLITIRMPGLGASLEYGKLGAIFMSWFLNPAAALFFAYLTYKIIGPLLRKIKNIILLNQILTVLVIVASAYGAYAIGANDVGTSTGIIYAYSKGTTDSLTIALFGAIALSVGSIMFSRRVIKTVGSNITTLDATTAFSAQFGAAFTIWLFVQFALPVSTSHAIVGAVAGVGLVKGASSVSKKKVGHIAIAWVLTPVLACLLSFALGWVLLGL